MADLFHPGEVYKRTAIHDQYGGQQRGGISTPAKHPYIFLFTGTAGEMYGYRDKWEGETFLYTGEGQKGNMEFVSGNKAVRDSQNNGEELHLFKQVRKGFVEYVGRMEYKGYRVINGRDVENKSRELIVFELSPID